MPYAAVERPEYRSFTGSRTSEKALSARVREIHGDMLQDLSRKLRNATITLAVDGWTDVRCAKVVNAVALVENGAFFLKSFFLEDRETGEVIGANVLEAISMASGMGGRVRAIVTDNAKNMINA
jgi:hypothetical protein